MDDFRFYLLSKLVIDHKIVMSLSCCCCCYVSRHPSYVKIGLIYSYFGAVVFVKKLFWLQTTSQLPIMTGTVHTSIWLIS